MNGQTCRCIKGTAFRYMVHASLRGCHSRSHSVGLAAATRAAPPTLYTYRYLSCAQEIRVMELEEPCGCIRVPLGEEAEATAEETQSTTQACPIQAFFVQV